jgi:alkanesulfonate monooxygenase SsuD/methylene tetrahydromethanopterin reductase-like flavin-dependent oxidoreductase (luciferase family)
MLKIGVGLPARFTDSGDYLADARAMDAAGVDSLWLDDDGFDRWLVLAAIAAVTGRARLIAPLGLAPGEPTAALGTRVATLAGLSRGRAVLAIGRAGSDTALGDLVALARSLDHRVIAEVAGERQTRLAAHLVDGIVSPDDSPEMLRASVVTLRRHREPTGKEPLEIWARAKMPDDREQWRRMLKDYEEAGATGIVLPFDPRLLDQLRNGDEDDDRSDLQLAQG